MSDLEKQLEGCGSDDLRIWLADVDDVLARLKALHDRIPENDVFADAYTDMYNERSDLAFMLQEKEDFENAERDEQEANREARELRSDFYATRGVKRGAI